MQIEPPDATPVSAAAFAARLRALRVGSKFCIAVSGGRDSMALLRLAADYSRNTGACVKGLIVDHGLRKESSAEAAKAKAWCDAAGVSARVLVWHGEKPVTGIQAAARAARYRLLASAANDLGAGAILTAHSADDQLETIMMRLERKAGATGLAGMREEIAIASGAGPAVRLLRPLLAHSRPSLTATAAHYGQDFIDDPSNEDVRFERVRVRAQLAELGVEMRAALLAMARRMEQAAADAKAREEQAFVHARGVFTRWGGASTRYGAVIPARLAARLIRAVSGNDHAPDPQAAAAAVVQAWETGGAVLGGVLLRPKGEFLWFLREPAAITGREGVAPLARACASAGETVLWDGRFVIGAAEEAVEVDALGNAGGADLLGAASGLIEAPREAVMSLPGLFQGRCLIGVPGVLFRDIKGVFARSLAQERFGGEIVRF